MDPDYNQEMAHTSTPTSWLPCFISIKDLHSIRIVVDTTVRGHEARLVLSRCASIVCRWHVGLVSHDVRSVVARNSGVVRGPLLHVLLGLHQHGTSDHKHIDIEMKKDDVYACESDKVLLVRLRPFVGMLITSITTTIANRAVST